MFDCHAHYGEKTGNALVCTASPEEAFDEKGFPFRSIGLIPEGGSKDLEKLEERLQDHSFLGEIGIDKRYPEIEEQIRLFRSALALGKAYDTLVTIHSVGYTDTLLSVLKEMKPKHFIVHGFIGSLETAREIERLGGLISISPRLEKAKSFDAIIRNTSFLMETDRKTGKE
ncbi:MAG: TatD family hydrolase, partial [Spirochaetales bacterium]|nr:TatD family hydrolase [Candidatus Physcosoma equi]